MSRSSISEDVRGQTEPLAALVAVTFLAVGLAMYGNVITDAVPGTSDEALEGVTLDRVWHELSVNNRYDESEQRVEDLPVETFPEGKVVYVEVWKIDDDGQRVYHERVKFDRSGTVVATGAGIERPEDPQSASRPIPIAESPGVVDGGRLTVEVWD